ncbi:uncharacterized protein LOC132178217 [Corylus avellana]|uniref:uncharacterized protein LOC132178217 n=1 Tax=Corylus avellana TaxID=13451 RepID=UPI00286D5B93|nr:uncharacterized protein LOC132178217 [Corylus avellana]
MDSILMVNECVDSRIRSRESGLICKLDLEKANDNVNWDFLLYMLERCGFGERWQGFFSSSRGVRQRDPLSPLLFVLVMEAFSRMMNATVERDLMAGFSVGSRHSELMVVSHLLFADDTLIFCEPKVEQLREVGDVEGLSRILGCGVDSVPFAYLGLPSGAHYKDPFIWNNVIEKIETKLAG